MIKKLFLLSFLLFLHFFSQAEFKKDSLKYAMLGWHFGANFGMYFADRTPASFYNGSGENNLKATIIDNYYNKQAIQNALHHDFSIDSNSLPKKMKYSPAINIGFIAKYNFNKRTGYFIEFNYAKLKASDVFTIKIDSFNSTSEPSLKTEYLFGKEERIDFNIGINTIFGKLQKIKPYAEFGINMNNVKVLESRAQVANMVYSLVSPNNTYYKIVQGGIGFGVFAGAGVQIIFTQSFLMNIGADVSLKRINLGTNTPYRPQETVFVRLILKNVFASKEEE
jgi:hypothetical protein